jgi:hypothetical protein
MARTAGDLDNCNLLTANKNSSLNFSKVAIGGTGAVGAITGCPGFSYTRTGTGAYTMVFPACVDALILPSFISAAGPTIFDITVTAMSATAGTATFQTRNAAGAATDPASGDILGFVVFSKLSAI